MTSPKLTSTAAGLSKQRLPKAVVGLGLVSLFTDVSSDAIFPLLPAFLVSLGSSSAFIGFVEGAAELVSNLLKYVIGKVSDRRANMKPLVLLGYGFSTVVRPLVALATSPWHVLLVRVGDRIGKGVRTSPRDALIAAVTDPSMRARAFGFHRAMDHSGAAIGTLLASLALYYLGTGANGSAAATDNFRRVFLWAAIPGFIAMLVLVFVREPTVPTTTRSIPKPERAVSGELKRVLVALTLFAVANATDAFILVKAAKLGAAAAVAPILWLILHVVKASTATAGGRLADKYGKRNALILGWCVYAVLWAWIGIIGSLSWLFILVGLYGVSHGLVEGAERGLIADLADGRSRGSAFGSYNMLIGLAAMASSTAFGAVWDHWGSATAFCCSAAFAPLAALVLYRALPSWT